MMNSLQLLVSSSAGAATMEQSGSAVQANAAEAQQEVQPPPAVKTFTRGIRDSRIPKDTSAVPDPVVRGQTTAPQQLKAVADAARDGSLVKPADGDATAVAAGGVASLVDGNGMFFLNNDVTLVMQRKDGEEEVLTGGSVPGQKLIGDSTVIGSHQSQAELDASVRNMNCTAVDRA
jgi:hypothetical protein